MIPTFYNHGFEALDEASDAPGRVAASPEYIHQLDVVHATTSRNAFVAKYLHL